ncbi:hypothetical protein SHXM_01816 [Streptomyces hygroscopicus]|nr:hypothetical protein SHXM_01816 [Streptomyces hygroscopicus]
MPGGPERRSHDYVRTGTTTLFAALEVATGKAIGEVARLGGAMAIAGMLSLTRDECIAFALLLSALTTENFGTVKAWPVVHARSDGGVVALVEETKPPPRPRPRAPDRRARGSPRRTV